MDAIQIKTDPDPMQPFNISQGYVIGNLVLTSGQAALDEEGNLIGIGDFNAQAEQTFSRRCGLHFNPSPAARRFRMRILRPRSISRPPFVPLHRPTLETRCLS